MLCVWRNSLLTRSRAKSTAGPQRSKSNGESVCNRAKQWASHRTRLVNRFDTHFDRIAEIVIKKTRQNTFADGSYSEDVLQRTRWPVAARTTKIGPANRVKRYRFWIIKYSSGTVSFRPYSYDLIRIICYAYHYNGIDEQIFCPAMRFTAKTGCKWKLSNPRDAHLLRLH